jgi:antitoxin ParD1/3/4
MNSYADAWGSGQYASESEVMRAAMRSIDRDEEENAHKLAALYSAIERSIVDADAGRVRPAEDVFTDLRVKYKRIAASQGFLP